MNESIKTQIEERLQQAFAPTFLQVDDESWQHGGGPDAQSHFKIILVCEAFAPLKLLARHRSVQEKLADITSQVRAISLHTLTPEDWQKAQDNGTGFRSPGCHNKK
jgi:BolA protein